MQQQTAPPIATVTEALAEYVAALPAGGFVNELCVSQAMLADALGLSPGSVRNWSSRGGIGRVFRRRLAEFCLHQRHVAAMWGVALKMKRVLHDTPLSYLLIEDFDPSPRGLQPPSDVPEAVRTLCLTQDRMAHILGVHPSTLRNWKAGIARPRPKAYVQLSHGLETLAWHFWAAAVVLDQVRVDEWIRASVSVEDGQVQV